MTARRLAALPLLWLLTAAAPPLDFVAVQPRFAGAAEEYRQIWDREGERIVAMLERDTGLAFPAAPIDVIVHQGPAMTSYDGRTIRMRAGYSPDYKLATLVHELGHRISFALPRSAELDDHRILYLFLYDVWTDLYGRDFADRMVHIEHRISGVYDYRAAWDWALAMTREQRQARLRTLVATMRTAHAAPTLPYEPGALLDPPQASANQSAASSRPRLR